MHANELSAPITHLISVVIPAGQVDEWLDLSIRSALASEGVDLEVVVSLNGATIPDGWWALREPRVVVLEDPKRLGAAGATMRGLEHARGEYYAHLDADDLMTPDRLARQVTALMKRPELTVVGSEVAWIDPAGDRVGAFSLPTGADVRSGLLRENVVPHSAWLTRMALVRELGGYRTDMPQMEDYDFLLRAGAKGPIANLGGELTQYRLHPGQLSRSVLPTGRYVRTVLRGQRELGRTLGRSRVRTWLGSSWWWLQQWLMWGGRKLRGLLQR